MARRRRLVLKGVAASGASAAAAAAARHPTLVPWPSPVRIAVPALCAALAAAAGSAVGGAVATIAGAPPAPGRVRRVARRGAVGLAAAGVLGAAGSVAGRRAIATLAADGREQDAAFSVPPRAAGVSGSKDSLVPLSTMGREGARFVWSASSADAIERVLGRPAAAAPIRVFVGFDSAATVAERVDLAMAELRRTGAFDRAHLLVQAPAGSGFANSTAVEVLELLSGGDCAAVAVGYGVLPSFLSLRRLGIAAETQRLLLDAIADELAGRERRPRLLAYGESLGAKVQQEALSAGPPDLDRHRIASALWVGTPGGPHSDAFHAAVAGESVTVDRPEQLPRPRPDARVWFLEHDGDPVVRFRGDLALRRPEWLDRDRPRGRNVPEAMTWVPLVTWLQVLVDTLFATDVRPGDFQSAGHDYRADLGAVATAAYGLDADPATAERLEEELRLAEVTRAELISGTS